MPLAYFDKKQRISESKTKLDAATSEEDPTPGMTQATADNYRAKKQKQSELVQKPKRD